MTFLLHTEAIGQYSSSETVFVGIVGGNGLEISVIAPKSELEILKGPMTPLGTKFYELQKGGICTYK